MYFNNKNKIMEAGTIRFGTKLSREQKDLFQYAANLGGYSTLTEFVIFSAQAKSRRNCKEAPVNCRVNKGP